MVLFKKIVTKGCFCLRQIVFGLLLLMLFLPSTARANPQTDFADSETQASTPADTQSENSLAVSDTQKRKLQSVVKSSDNVIYQGEMYLRFSLGLTVPLFSNFFNDPSIGKNGYTNNSKLYGVPVGGSAAVDFIYFLEKNWGVGVELGLLLMQTQANYQSLVTVGARAQYMLRRWPFDIPFSVSLGVAFNSLYIEDVETMLYAGPYIKPDFGFFYNINDKWSVGFNTTFLVVSEFYFREDKKNQSNFSAFWDITLSARYRF